MLWYSMIKSCKILPDFTIIRNFTSNKRSIRSIFPADENHACRMIHNFFHIHRVNTIRLSISFTLKIFLILRNIGKEIIILKIQISFCVMICNFFIVDLFFIKPILFNYFNVIGYLNNTGTLATIPSTATYDGWLYINAKDGADSYIIIDDSPASFGTSVFGNNGLGSQSIGLLCLMCPIRKGHAYNVRIKSAGIVSARIYPAQGNV